MTTALDLYNMALSSAGAQGSLSSLSDQVREKEICDIWYPTVRRSVQRMARWPGSAKIHRCALISERDLGEYWDETLDPNPRFSYKYALPSDYLHAWHLGSYEQFSIDFLAGRKVLSTSRPQAILHYAFDQEVVNNWAPDQLLATVHALAGYIGATIGQPELIGVNKQEALRIGERAAAQAANEQHVQIEHIPDWLHARGYEDAAPSARYYYPLVNHFAGLSS